MSGKGKTRKLQNAHGRGNITFLCTAELRDKLISAAERGDHSLGEEVRIRLMKSFWVEFEKPKRITSLSDTSDFTTEEWAVFKKLIAKGLVAPASEENAA